MSDKRVCEYGHTWHNKEFFEQRDKDATIARLSEELTGERQLRLANIAQRDTLSGVIEDLKKLDFRRSRLLRDHGGAVDHDWLDRDEVLAILAKATEPTNSTAISTELVVEAETPNTELAQGLNLDARLNESSSITVTNEASVRALRGAGAEGA